MPETLVERLNSLTGWVKEMGIVILAASPDEVTCEWTSLRSTINRMGSCTEAPGLKSNLVYGMPWAWVD